MGFLSRAAAPDIQYSTVCVFFCSFFFLDTVDFSCFVFLTLLVALWQVPVEIAPCVGG